MLNNLLFDLDGTIMDPKDGFVNCVRYALEKLGRPSPEEAAIAARIGPPLPATFENLLGSTDPELIGKAVELYRERYAEKGIFENTPYPGILDLLRDLHTSGCSLWIVTFKPVFWTRQIVGHFSLDRWITDIFGPTLNERVRDKVSMIGSLLREYRLDPAATVMIGDRKEDILAGHENAVATIGVTWGYGRRPEIDGAGPDYTCDTPPEISRIVKNHVTG